MKNVSHNVNTLKCRIKELEKGEGAVRAPLSRKQEKSGQQQQDRNKMPEALLREDHQQRRRDRNRQIHGGKIQARHLCIKTETIKKPTKDKNPHK